MKTESSPSVYEKEKKKKNYGVFRQWNTTQQQKGMNY